MPVPVPVKMRAVRAWVVAVMVIPARRAVRVTAATILVDRYYLQSTILEISRRCRDYEAVDTKQWKGRDPVTEPALAPRDQLVNTPKGNVFVREIPGDDPPIVLMHGFPDDHIVYDRLLPLLSPRRAVAFDWRGYGRSERGELGGFSLQDHGAALEALLDQLDIEQAVLVGHDASGPDAVAFAIAHPQRVRHLVLLNTIFGHLPSLKLPELIRLLADPALAPLADAMISDDAQRLWLLQFTADHWGEDAVDPQGVALRSI